MEWRFTIIDRNDNHTVIDEPLGWTELFFKLKRHPERHGTFREIQGNNFQFFELAASLIKAEYETYGAQGLLYLLIEMKCRNTWDFFHKGIFNFQSYNFNQDEICSVEIDIDQIGPIVDFINRFDQSVDITKSKSFDGVTNLTDYPFLDFLLLLPSKSIFVRARAYTKNENGTQYNVITDMDFANVPNVNNKGFIIPKLDGITYSEIKNFIPGYQFDYGLYDSARPFNTQIEPYHILEIKPESRLEGENIYTVSFRLKGSIISEYRMLGIAPNGALSYASVRLKVSIGLKYGKDKVDLLPPVQLFTFTDTRTNTTLITRTDNFDLAYSNTVTLKPDDKVWLYYFTEIQNSTNTNASPWYGVTISQTDESYFQATSVTKAIASFSKVGMINETISRVIESITDNQLKLYSEYFGRTNSAPYSFPADGCGANRVLTNGLNIRDVYLPNGDAPSVFITMKDIWESLRATDNIGMGFEENKIRIENWKFFYNDTVIHRCLDILKVKRSVKPDEIFSKFIIGFDKWETENYNGLDEFLTKREYRLDIPQVKNTLELICKFIVSGYATEVTRRLGNTSTDWRYDNNIFMICVEPDGATYKVELNNIIDPANIIDPPTVYNFRLTPARNAVRWFDRIIGSYRNVNTGHKIIFASGEGNYVAEGNLFSVNCKLEYAVLKENQDLDQTLFIDDPGEGVPIMRPERVKFTYPLGADEYKTIQANPHGLIEFTSPHDSGFGWIDEITYRPEEGLADFILIPKI